MLQSLQEKHGVSQNMLKPLVLAIQISLCTSAVLSATQAIANTNTYQHYQIQPTTLRQALNAFALQTGINISMNSDQLQNIPSQGLSGQYTLEQGFAELLKNTDFQAQRSGDGFVLVEKPKMQQSQTRDMGQLKTIDVIANGTNTKSNAMQLPTIAVTAENEKSYTVNKIQVGTKMEQELKDIPRSISAISRQQLDDQGITDMDSALKQLGVTVNPTLNRTGFVGDSIF